LPEESQVTRAVEDRDPDVPAAAARTADTAGGQDGVPGKLINVAWAARLFALLCAVSGIYVVVVSVGAIRGGRSAASWLLPLATGGLAAVLCAGVVSASAARYLSWRSIGERTLAVVLLVLYAFLLLPALGFLLGSLIFVAAVTIVYARRRLAVGLGGAAVAVALWALFAYVVAEPLPAGWLWR